MDGFKVPQSIPQDLLLIQEYIGVPPPLPVPKKLETDADVDDDDDISSSSDEDSEESDIANEKEIAADLTVGAVTDEDDLSMKK
jgi:H/ACA ribonucleoprotein complex non-core subunit NAF1